jgi:integrase
LASSFLTKEGQGQGQEEGTRIINVTEGLKSPLTKKTYRLAFEHFLKVTVKNFDRRALLDTKQNIIESKIIDHIIYLRDVKKLSYWSIQEYCSGILHFFKMNDISLNVDKIKRFLPQDESEHYATDRPYSVTEIGRIIEQCDVRSKVIILLMASTGMRIGALPGLRVGDIKRMDEFGVYMIWAYNRSRVDRYYTFCTPSCAYAIDSYLDYRRSFKEEIKDKSPLIREEFNIDDGLRVKYPRFLSQRMFCFIVEDVLKRAGVNQIAPGNKRREVMRSHGFRKFFITQCDKAHMPFTVREFISGHRLPNQDASYILRTEEETLAEYAKAIPLLETDPNQRLKQENKELKKAQKDYLAEFDELREEMHNMKNMLLYLDKPERTKLVHQFFDETSDSLQDKVWAEQSEEPSK